MTSIRMTVPGVFDHHVGDLWRVAAVDAVDGVTYERVCAAPDQYRKPGDGLHPRVPAPDTRPVSDEEARALADQMDAAMAKGRADANAWPFSPDNPLNSAGR